MEKGNPTMKKYSAAKILLHPKYKDSVYAVDLFGFLGLTGPDDPFKISPPNKIHIIKLYIFNYKQDYIIYKFYINNFCI